MAEHTAVNRRTGDRYSHWSLSINVLMKIKIFTNNMNPTLKPLIIPVTRSIDVAKPPKPQPTLKSKDGIMKF